MQQKVIIDLGCHKGEDSDFYLRKGFRVIGVEASKKMCEVILERFKNHPYSQAFTLLNYAVTEKDNEEITFYENTNSVWGTIFDSWDARNKTFGASSVKTTTKTIRLDTLIQNELKAEEQIEYVKIDIEGADTLALKSLSKLEQKPFFISIESEKVSWERLLEEFAIFKSLGYTKFKLVDQSKIQEQQCPSPSKEGNYVNHSFEPGSSGLFGNELPGEWLNEEAAIAAYKKVFKRYKYFGDFGVFNNKLFMRNRYLNKLLRIFSIKYPHVGWYDTHASL